MLQLLPILCQYREDKELDDVILKNHRPRLNLRFSFSYRRNARKRGTISAHSELMVFKFSSNSNTNNHNHNDNNTKNSNGEYHDFVQCWELTRLPKWTEAFRVGSPILGVEHN